MLFMKENLTKEEYNPYYEGYISKASHSNIIEGLQMDKDVFIHFIETLPNDKWTYAYAEGKWTIAEVLQHIIDTERIFSYRAFCFARNDKTPLAGFEQDEYVPSSGANNYTKAEMLSDFLAVRHSTISLFSTFNDKMLQRIGIASGSPMSARAAGYILSGHQNHHVGIIEERYL